MNYSGQKQLRGGKDLFGLGFHVTVYHSRRLEKEFMQELETKTVKGCCLLADSLTNRLLLSYLPYTTQDHQPREWSYPQWAEPPTSISNQYNSSQTCPQTNLMEVMS